MTETETKTYKDITLLTYYEDIDDYTEEYDHLYLQIDSDYPCNHKDLEKKNTQVMS